MHSLIQTPSQSLPAYIHTWHVILYQEFVWENTRHSFPATEDNMGCALHLTLSCSTYVTDHLTNYRLWICCVVATLTAYIGVFECYIDTITLTHVHTQTALVHITVGHQTVLHCIISIHLGASCTGITQFCLQAL